MVPLRTERLTLRAFLPEDAQDLFALNADPEVMEFLGESSTLTECEAWIVWLNATYPPASERGFWAAEEDGRFIGWFHLRPSKDTGELELGYRLRRDAWGRGLATEGSRALLDLAGEPVIARTMIANRRSRRVMEKCGMAVVRTFPFTGEGPDDEVEYGTRRRGGVEVSRSPRTLDTSTPLCLTPSATRRRPEGFGRSSVGPGGTKGGES